MRTIVDRARIYLTQRLFPAHVFLVKSLVIFRTSEVAPVRLKTDDVSVRWASPEDLPALNRINSRRELHASLFEQGWTCTIAHRSLQPVSYLWIDPSEWHVSNVNGFRIRRAPHSCWASYLYVRPEVRLLGVFHRHWAETIRLLAPRGVHQIFHSANAENQLVIRSLLRMGSRIAYRYRVARLGPLLHHRAVPDESRELPASSGWGEWRLEIR